LASLKYLYICVATHQANYTYASRREASLQMVLRVEIAPFAKGMAVQQRLNGKRGIELYRSAFNVAGKNDY
jgi:hypothetical protein